MSWQTFLIEQGAIHTSGTIIFPSVDMAPTGFCAMPQLCTIAVQGPDAVKFLQGQVTCDIKQLASLDFSLGAHCNHKGRIRFNFIAKAIDDQTILLIVPDTMETIAIDSLKKYSVFSNVSITALSYYWLATSGQDLTERAQAFLAESKISIAETFTLWGTSDAEKAKNLWSGLDAEFEKQNSSLGDYLLTRSGIGLVQPETLEFFIPQMLNLQAVAQGISFQKGCYTGQEVVARMTYLGKLKKRMYLFSSSTEAAPGTAIVDEAEKKAGEVVSSCANHSQPDEHLVLAVVNNDQANSTLHIIEKSQQKLQPMSLPYAINKETT